MKRKSTVTNLLEYKNYLCNAFAKNKQVDSIYTDFSKAFDKVNHSLLCRKLQSMGIHGSLLRWIESYLSNRSQLVALKGELSEPTEVTSGVPQGSHLGPLLFNIYINDLVDQLCCPCLLYADDLKIFLTINSINDAMLLQKDLDTVAQWCHTNRMFLNTNKCFVVTFTRKINKICFNYQLKNQSLGRFNQAKDLGVIFDEKLTFREHYDHIHSKASKVLGFVMRNTKHFHSPQSSVYLFNALVRSILEYAAVIWAPFYAKHCDHIERLQKKFLKVLSFRQGLHRKLGSYRDRLTKFCINTLESRRKRSDLICLYKIIHAIIDSPSLLSSINLNTIYRTRCPKLFSLQVYRNNTSYYNPLVRMCRLYNDLVQEHPEIDIFTHRPNMFKRSVTSVLV